LFEVEVIGPEWYSMDRGNQSCERNAHRIWTLHERSMLLPFCLDCRSCLQVHPNTRIESRQVATISTKHHANIIFFQLGTFGRGKAKVEAMQKVIAESRRTQAAH
jgi:hypothetical protein